MGAVNSRGRTVKGAPRETPSSEGEAVSTFDTRQSFDTTQLLCSVKSVMKRVVKLVTATW